MSAADGLTQAVIRTEELARTYQMGTTSVNALRCANLKVHSGEFVALMGSSGSGKTTLLHLLGGLDRASSGHYWLEGKEVSSLSRDDLAEIRGRRIGFIFQSFNLLPRLSSWENVCLPLSYRKGEVPSNLQKDAAMEALQRVRLEKRAKHLPSELSGGERQRVAIARALVIHPAVILADEPTGNLDSATGAEIMNLIDELHREGTTIVMVTHDPSIARHADRVCSMRDGFLHEGENNNDPA